MLFSYKQQLTSRVQETDSVVLGLRQQISTLNDQLSEKTSALNDEVARVEQQVPSLIHISHCSPPFPSNGSSILIWPPHLQCSSHI